MRILIVTQYIYPETFRSSDLAFELAKRGHSVDVLTGIPNYPTGRYFKGYGVLRKRFEKINGVRFFRCFQTPRKLFPSNIGLSINYLSFVVSASFWVLLYFSWKKYDVIITHEPSPITQILPALLLKKLKGTPVLSWIMDIWPDSITDSVSNRVRRIILPPLSKITESVYKGSDRILITSKKFSKFINRNSDYSDKIVYFPNWGDELYLKEGFTLPNLPKGFVIMVAGNLGESQDIPAITKAITLLKDVNEVKWVFLGDGSKRKWLEDYIEANDLSEYAIILGKYPSDTMLNFFLKSNAMLVSLSSGFDFLDATVPARLQSYMAAGRPVLAMIGSGGQEIINESNCGYAVNSGDSESLAELIKNIVLVDKENFEKLGQNGRLYFDKEFRLNKCIDNLEKIINGVINGN